MARGRHRQDDDNVRFSLRNETPRISAETTHYRLKANVHEIADTFRKTYPSAKVLYPGKEDFTPANRKEVFSKIKNNNWDCIILTHDQFAKIPQSEQTMIDIFTEELADVERNLEVLEQSIMRYRSGKMQDGLEKRKQNLTAKLKELRMKINDRKDDTVDFSLDGHRPHICR